MTIGVSLTTAARSWKATVNTRCPPPMPIAPKSRCRSLRTMQYTYLPPSGGIPLVEESFSRCTFVMVLARQERCDQSRKRSTAQRAPANGAGWTAPAKSANKKRQHTALPQESAFDDRSFEEAEFHDASCSRCIAGAPGLALFAGAFCAV